MYMHKDFFTGTHCMNNRVQKFTSPVVPERIIKDEEMTITHS